MPVYVYKCSNEQCKNIFELFKSYTPDRLETCQICGKIAERIPAVSNFNRVDLRSQRLFGHDLKGQKK